MSGRLPALTAKQVIRALERAGYFVHHTTGSHYAMRHPTDLSIRITVPYHRKSLQAKTLHSIIRRAGLTRQQFLDLL